jgi:ubiquinone biosynthesis protein
MLVLLLLLMHKKEMKRIAQVVSVMLKNNLGFLIEELSLKLHLPFTKRFLMNKKKNSDFAVGIRKSMEDLGGAFIKFGQLLSLRPDLIPQDFCNEFKKLLDDVPPESFDSVKKQIEKGLNKKIDSVFKHIDKVPVGSASVAQVYKAKLLNNKDVVVKVLRKDIAEKFLVDISVLKFFASKIENRFKNLPIVPLKIIEEFERYSKNELNLVFEARNIERFCSQKHSHNVVFPKVYWHGTSKNVLTIDFLDGKKLNQIKKPDKVFCKVIIDELLNELFNYGFFHSDLHPGNIIVMKNGYLGFIDFGIVGYIDENLKMLALLLYKAIIKKDSEAVLNALLKYGSYSRKTDLNKFKQEIADILNEWYINEDNKVSASHSLHQLFISCTKNGFTVPSNAVLFAKALLTAEGTCRYIDPDFNFVEYSQKKSSQILSGMKSPRAIKNYIAKETKNTLDNIRSLPKEGLNLLQKINSGRFEFALDDSHFKRIGFNISGSSNRLAYALIITALIISSSLLIEFGPFIDGYPIFSIIGLTFAGILMIVLFLSIIREKKEKLNEY